MAPAVRSVFNACDIVGESLIWDERQRALVWVDIVGKRIRRFAPDTGSEKSWATPDFPTSIGLCEDGRAVVGLRKGVALWDWNETWETLALIEAEDEGTRLNEGRVSPDGAFWVASMANNFDERGRPIPQLGARGKIYRVGPDGSVALLSSDTFGIPNTMIWTEDSRFLIADTVENAFYGYDVLHDGTLSGRTPFGRPIEIGLPDGSCRDAEGCIWTCRVAGGSAVTRMSPTGDILSIVQLPCSWPTSCTFGGSDYATLFITSARFTMSEMHLRNNPSEGNLFAFRPAVPGYPEQRFAHKRAEGTQPGSLDMSVKTATQD